MHKPQPTSGCNSQQAFCLRFKRRIRELLALGHSAAESFGIVWERTLDALPLDDDGQAEIYWELIEWAGAEQLSTGARAHELVSCGARIAA